jgi:hypothetical protein
VPQKPEYHAFLLRLWRDETDQSWRCSLQTGQGERQGFPDLESLFLHLMRLTEDAPPAKGANVGPLA